MEKCIVTQSRLLIVRIHWEFTINTFHERLFWFHTRVLYSAPRRPIILLVNYDSCWQHQMSVRSGMTGQAGGFQNPGVCLQAFPSFLPRPSPLFYLRHFSRGLWLSFLVLCSCTARKRLLRRLHLLKCSFKSALNTKNIFATVALQTEQKRYYHCKIFMKLWSLLTTREQCNFRCCRQLNHTVHVSYCKRLTQF